MNALSRFFRIFQSQIDLYQEVSARPPLDKLIEALAAVNASRRANLGVSKNSTSTSLELQRSVCELISSTTPDRVKVEKSTIPNSGVGLFAAEKLLLGTVVCLYPGMMYSKFASSHAESPTSSIFRGAWAFAERTKRERQDGTLVGAAPRFGDKVAPAGRAAVSPTSDFIAIPSGSRKFRQVCKPQANATNGRSIIRCDKPFIMLL